MSTQATYSNYHLTAHPRILFWDSRRTIADAALWEQVFGPEVRQEVREFTPKMLGKVTGEDQNILHALDLLRDALSSSAGARAMRNLYKAVGLLIPKQVRLVSFAGIDRQRVLQLYIKLTRQYMKRTRLTMIAENDGPAVAIMCADLFTAAVVFAVYDQTAVCPACGKVFAPSSERNQKFCSKNCGQRIYQKRYREREKKRNQKGARRR
jgi:hypothetical protein